MTNEQIDDLINQFNTGSGDAVIIPSALTPKVAMAQVWLPDIGTCIQDAADRFFFVKANGDDYVGSVQDGGVSDLHVYLKDEYRGCSILSAALNDVIFPWLAQKDGRSEQRLTFQEPKVKRHFAGRLGFRSTGPLTSRKSLRSYRDRPVEFMLAPALTATAFTSMKRRLDRASQLVQMVRAEVESHGLGAELSKSGMNLQTVLDYLSGLDDNIRYDAYDAQGVWV